MKQGITLLAAGQALIRGDLREIQDPRLSEVTRQIRSADLAFTNFEGAVMGSHSCWPTKRSFCSGVDAEVLNFLESSGFSVLALANNHAFDLGPGGILATLEEVRKYPFLSAGIGEDFSQASKPGYADYPFGRAALVAMHCGGKAEAAMSWALNAQPHLPARPGVNGLEWLPTLTDCGERAFCEEDTARHLEAISHAAKQADFVIVYIHHHTVSETPECVPASYRRFCRECIDSGASIVIGHGTPVFQGIEVYCGKPIIYNSANLIFHTQSVEMWSERYGSKPWESFLASAKFGPDGNLLALDISPVVLGNPSDLIHASRADRRMSYPVFAEGQQGEAIIDRLTLLSKDLGTSLTKTSLPNSQYKAVWRPE